MGTRCLRKTYTCQKGYKCSTCKMFDNSDDTLKVISVSNQTMVVDCRDRSLIKRCLNPRPVKGSDTQYYVPNTLFNMYILGLYSAEDIKGELRAEVAAPLYDHQIANLSEKVENPFVLNANKMGYGKTVTGLAYARQHNCKKILIVCPKSVLYHWKDTVGWYWPERLAETQILPKLVKDGPQITIINYDMLISGNRIEMYKNFVWDCIILDEGHRIKNRKSKRASAVKAIPSQYRVALTGTPILRYPDDLFSLCEWLSPKIFGKGYWPFAEKFCKINEDFFGKKIVGATDDEQTVTDLHNFLRTFMIRDDEIQIGQGIRHNVIKFELPPQVRSVYKLVQQQAVEELSGMMTLQNAMSKTIRCRQLTSHPGQFDGSFVKLHTKFLWIKDLLEDNPDIKIVVFSCFSTSIKALQQFVGSGKCRTYTGDLSDNMREKHKKQFIENKDIRVLAGTIGAMAESVDGLQDVSHIAVFLDRDWSPEINKQAEGRLVRDRQQYVVECYLLEYEDTIDQYVGRVNLNKAEDVRRVLNGESISV